jgi:hypothetical protein
MRAFVFLFFVGCAALTDPCWALESASLAGGAASLTTPDGTFAVTAFKWVDGSPKDELSALEFDFGKQTLRCTTSTRLADVDGRVPISSLVTASGYTSPCQIILSDDTTLDWTGGTITVEQHGSSYDIRLDAAATEVSSDAAPSVTIELDGVTGTAAFTQTSCSSGGGGGWWL